MTITKLGALNLDAQTSVDLV